MPLRKELADSLEAFIKSAEDNRNSFVEPKSRDVAEERFKDELFVVLGSINKDDLKNRDDVMLMQRKLLTALEGLYGRGKNTETVNYLKGYINQALEITTQAMKYSGPIIKSAEQYLTDTPPPKAPPRGGVPKPPPVPDRNTYNTYKSATATGEAPKGGENKEVAEEEIPDEVKVLHAKFKELSAQLTSFTLKNKASTIKGRLQEIASNIKQNPKEKEAKVHEQMQKIIDEAKGLGYALSATGARKVEVIRPPRGSTPSL